MITKAHKQPEITQYTLSVTFRSCEHLYTRVAEEMSQNYSNTVSKHITCWEMWTV